MTTRSFGLEVRVLMCGQCGAPIDVPEAGGMTKCEYCNATLQVGRRRVDEVRIDDPTIDPNLGPEEREAARQASLRAQAENYNEENPYAYYAAPDGYEYLGGTTERDPATATLAMQAFKAAVEQCQKSDGALPDQRIVYWLARKLKNIWAQRNEPLRARAAVETAHELLTDAGYQHVFRTMMADLARGGDDLDGAEAWLAKCDPAPWLLDLDTDYRTSKAAVAACRGRWQEILTLVGEQRGQIPYEPSSVAVSNSLRVVAFERLGRTQEAEAELRWLIEESVVPVDFLRAMFDKSVIYPAALEVWARLEAPKPQPVATNPSPAQFESALPVQSGGSGFVVWVVLGIVATLAGLFFALVA